MYDDDLYGQSTPRNPMATAALVLGILSIMTCYMFYISLPLGAVAVICSALSRDRSSMPGRAKVGTVCGIAGILISICVTVTAFVSVIRNPALRSYVEQYIQIYTGDSSFDLDQALDELLPFFHTKNADESETEERARLHMAPSVTGQEESGSAETTESPSQNPAEDSVSENPADPEDSPSDNADSPAYQAPENQNPAEDPASNLPGEQENPAGNPDEYTEEFPKAENPGGTFL